MGEEVDLREIRRERERRRRQMGTAPLVDASGNPLPPPVAGLAPDKPDGFTPSPETVPTPDLTNAYIVRMALDASPWPMRLLFSIPDFVWAVLFYLAWSNPAQFSPWFITMLNASVWTEPISCFAVFATNGALKDFENNGKRAFDGIGSLIFVLLLFGVVISLTVHTAWPLFTIWSQVARRIIRAWIYGRNALHDGDHENLRFATGFTWITLSFIAYGFILQNFFPPFGDIDSDVKMTLDTLRIGMIYFFGMGISECMNHAWFLVFAYHAWNKPPPPSPETANVVLYPEETTDETNDK